MGYSLFMMADFQNVLTSRILRVFWSGFMHSTTLKCLLEFQFLTQNEDFAWAIAFSRWLIFKMFSLLEYCVCYLGRFFAQHNSK